MNLPETDVSLFGTHVVGFCYLFSYSLLVTRCYTLNTTGQHKNKLTIKFLRDNNLKHTVYLHDPDMFLITSNPVAVPRAVLHTTNNSGLQNVFIEATQHRRWVAASSPPGRHKAVQAKPGSTTMRGQYDLQLHAVPSQQRDQHAGLQVHLGRLGLPRHPALHQPNKAVDLREGTRPSLRNAG